MSEQKENGIYTPEEKKKAAYALNLCTVSISQIIDYNDINILNQEYENILNNLNLEQMPKDEALLDVLKEILDVITFFRISAGDQKFVDLEYQKRMQNAVWSAIPNVGMLFATSNPIAMGVTLATQVGIGYMNYRRHRAEYQLNRQKEEWQLKRSALDQLNGLRKQLFETSWRLAEEYNFPDRYRLSDDQIHRYNEILAETNSLKRFNKLDAIREDFAAYPPFWYQIGSTANCIYRDPEWGLDISAKARFKEQAIMSFEEYRKLNQFNILRNDILTSSWALEYIDLLDLSSEANRKEGAALVDIAEKYSGKANDVLELCAYAYLKIGDRRNAARIFYYLVNQDYNVPVTAKVLSALYILKSRKAGNTDNGTADYKMLERLVGSEYILPMPGPDVNLLTWNPAWKLVADDQEEEAEEFNVNLELAKRGNAEAQLYIGYCYGNGDVVEENEEEAAKWFELAATQGLAEAQRMVGFCYMLGSGVQEDPAIAAAWFKKSAEQGDADAQYLLAVCYAWGDGVQKNLDKAEEWLRQAKEQGQEDSQYQLGIICYRREKYIDAVKLFRKEAEQGHSRGKHWLGLCYKNGKGVVEDEARAFQLFQEAAEQECPDSLMELGLCYIYKRAGVEKNLQTAESYFKRALAASKEHDWIFELDNEARTHGLLADTYYAMYVKDEFDLTPLDIAMAIPGINLVALPVFGASKIAETSKLKTFLKTEEGEKMIRHYRIAADLGWEFAIKRLEKLESYK